MRYFLISRNQSKLDAAAVRLRQSSGRRVEVHALDLTHAGAVKKAAAVSAAADILINNAGSIPQGDLLSVDEASWRAAWELKVFGFINLTREVYRHMVGRKSGVIINIIGSADERPTPSYFAGSTANAGLMQFTRSLGGERARCVSLAP
jgi:short-subunit dehydrogenase